MAQVKPNWGSTVYDPARAAANQQYLAQDVEGDVQEIISALSEERGRLTSENENLMSTPTREEFQARIETIEAKMDSRVASIEGKIDTLLATLQGNEKVYVERVKTYDARFTGFEERDKRLELLARQANESATVAADAAKQAVGLRASYWGSVAAQIAAVAAIIVGAYFANQSSVIGIGQLVSGVQQSQTPAPGKK